MSEQVFGLGVNQVMAYAAVANVLLVVVLARRARGPDRSVPPD